MQTNSSLRVVPGINHHQPMVDSKSSHYGTKPKTPMQLRFERVLELLGMAQREFVKLHGVTPQNLYSAYRRGKVGEAHIARLRELAKLKGMEGLTIDWLETGIGEEPRLQRNETLHAGALGAALNAQHRTRDEDTGSPTVVNARYVRFSPLEGFADEPTHPVDILSSLLRQNAALVGPSVRVITMPNDVMRGEIEEGDLVFVDSSVNTVKTDGIYVYKVNGSTHIRRIQKLGEKWLRFKGTHAYEDSIELAGDELADLEIGGRFIGRIGS